MSSVGAVGVVRWSEFKPSLVDGLVLILGVLYGAFAWNPTIPELDIRWDLTGFIFPVTWGLVKAVKIVPQKSKWWDTGTVLTGLIVFFSVASLFQCGCIKNMSKNPYWEDYVGTLMDASIYVGVFSISSLVGGVFLFYCAKRMTSGEGE